MKKTVFLLILSIIVGIGCTKVKTSTSGIENNGYLVFYGDVSKYKDEVEVKIDGKDAFKATVRKDKKKIIKDFKIDKGQHSISVLYKNKEVYSQQLFISIQELKKIYLP